jgi:hypothetical protein
MSTALIDSAQHSERPTLTIRPTARPVAGDAAPRATQDLPALRIAVTRIPARAGTAAEPREPKRFRERVLECDSYSIRVARSARQLRRASMLIERMYAWRGYQTETAASLELDPHRIVLEASGHGCLFGTLTLGIDSDNGLLADALYAPEIDVFRSAGHKVCELSRFAVDPQCSSKQMLASLFQLAYLYARFDHEVAHAFIEVNPRHAAFYKRMLGFRQLGDVRTCPRVDAPAVLLHLDLDYMDEQIRRHCGCFESGERSLYPYFVPCETDGLDIRIAEAA